MNITFCGMTMRTPVYVKLDAPEQLLPSEGVCRQLRIITYHPEVLVKKQSRSSPKEAEGGRTKKRGRPKKGEPALCAETVIQQGDVSQKPVVRGDRRVSVGQLDSVLRPE